MDCNFPLTVIEPRSKRPLTVPCGKCMACRIARVRDWSVRLLDESSCWDKTSFISLTYSEDHVPITNCGKLTLVKSDLQKFFKRCRKSLSSSIKYFACGEYGDAGHRPHFHAIVFGSDFTEDGDWYIHHYDNGQPIYTSDRISKLWPYGLATVDVVLPERIRYVCGYVEKKMYYNPTDNFLEGYGCLLPPFQLMSQGLGLRFFRKHESDYIFSLKKTINGVAYSFPRYYLKKEPGFAYHLKTKKGDPAKLLALQKEQSALDQGYSIIQSRLQREMDLKAKSKLKKSVL